MIKYKDIFKNILKDKYTIKFDKKYNDIIIINDHIKCKYILIFIEKKINNDVTLLMWSDTNKFSDDKTKLISKEIRDSLLKDKEYLLDQNNQLIINKDLIDLIETIIKNNKKINDIDTIWIINNNLSSEFISNNNNIIEYYLITDIINF
jgi:hypothetical protein